MKKILVLVLSLCLLLPAIIGCSSSDDGTLGTGYYASSEPAYSEPAYSEPAYEIQQYYDLVLSTQELLDDVADDIYSYWYDAIYKDKYGGSIDYAILYAQLANSENLDTIESNNETIKNLYSQIKDSKLNTEIKAVMQAYNAYYSLVVEVSGSFKSYSADKETLKKTLANALKNLDFEL